MSPMLKSPVAVSEPFCNVYDPLPNLPIEVNPFAVTEEAPL